MSPRAFASGVEVAGAVAISIAILLKFWPVIVAWLVGVRTLFGRPSGLKFGFGVVSSLGATIVTLIILEESAWFVGAAVLGVLVVGTHIVRFGTHLLGRATGGHPKETVRKWWRYL